MRYFLVKSKNTGKMERIPAVKEIFERETEINEMPYYQVIKGEVRLFAQCPSCKNPVQLIGLYKKTKNNPYAKHTGKNAAGFPPFKHEQYKLCPYRAKKIYKENEKRTLTKDALALEILTILKENFDRITYLLKKQFGINFSTAFMEKTLENYLAMQGYIYSGATLENIPWVLLYLSMNRNLYGQSIRKDSFIYDELKKKKHGIQFSETESTVKVTGFDCGFAHLGFFFTEHRSEPRDGLLHESISFRITIERNRSGITEKLLIKKIVFDHDYFLNLINYENNEHRNQDLFDLANKHLKGILS